MNWLKLMNKYACEKRAVFPRPSWRMFGAALALSLASCHLTEKASPSPRICQKRHDSCRIRSVRGQPESARIGDTLRITVNYDTGPDREVGAFAVYAYQRETPRACQKMGWKKRAAGSPKYHSYEIVPFKWLKKRRKGARLTEELRVDTTGWPPGDYRLRVKILLYDENGKDHYLPASVLVGLINPK